MSVPADHLAGIVTTDISGVTRGRFVPADRFDRITGSGIGWVPANISIMPSGGIAVPNPWGSAGDLRIMPDPAARFRTQRTGQETPFDMTCGNIVELDGSPWSCCTRTMLSDALDDLKSETGLSVISAYEQEFQVSGSDMTSAHPMSFAGLRRSGSFAPDIMAALSEAGVEPEMILAEYGNDQFEITHSPTHALAAADRAVAIREIVREIARNRGWTATFAPKTDPVGVGNGVHVHFSLVDAGGKPVMYEPGRPGQLSELAGCFCAGILKHLQAITAFSAASRPSYLRLQPHHWSASWTWLGERDRESTLRICPVVTAGGKDPARQFNIEFRAADATANPYLVLAALIRAGLEGIRGNMDPAPVFSGDPDLLSDEQRSHLGLKRLPQSLEAALAFLDADATVKGWFSPLFIETYLGEKRAELDWLAGLDDETVCTLYATLF